jgi:hypothetical protein
MVDNIRDYGYDAEKVINEFSDLDSLRFSSTRFTIFQKQNLWNTVNEIAIENDIFRP